jgi:hypothetical protein
VSESSTYIGGNSGASMTPHYVAITMMFGRYMIMAFVCFIMFLPVVLQIDIFESFKPGA